MSYDDAVCEALAFGWVDSTSRTLDDSRTTQYFAPRRRGSGWARSNKQRVEALEAAGLMTEAGRAVIRAGYHAKSEGDRRSAMGADRSPR